MEIQALGPVEVLSDGKPLRLGGPKQRTVLAVLVLELGRTIAVDSLIERVWREERTSRARGILHTYLSNLSAEMGDILMWEGGGYRLAVDRSEVDVYRFEDEVAAGMRLLQLCPLRRPSACA